MGSVPSGTLWLRAYVKGAKEQPTYSLRCLLGDEPPTVIEGYAIWNQITRPKRKSLTEWSGARPLKIRVKLVIDHFATNAGLACEEEMRQLELMAGASEKDKPVEHPPLVLWDANAMHDDREAGHLRWVIETLEWTAFLWNREGPNIIRAEATITLMEWVEDQYIRETGAKKNRTKKSKKKKGSKRRTSKRSHTYQVTIADTQKQGLRTVAQKRLGDSKRWREIGNAQKPKIRDPMNIRPGQVLKIPS